MPPDPPREQGPEGLATPTQINATPTSKTVENPEYLILHDFPGQAIKLQYFPSLENEILNFMTFQISHDKLKKLVKM